MHLFASCKIRRLVKKNQILHKKKSMQILESPIPPFTAAALRMIICKRPAPHFDNHGKGHEKCIFETLHNELKCFLSIKELIFNENGSKCSHLLMVMAKVANCPAVFLAYFSLWICYEIQLSNTKIKMSNEQYKSAERAIY